MRFVCTSKRAYVRAAMAHMFLRDAVERKYLNDIYNMDEVLEALDPVKLIDRLINDQNNLQHLVCYFLLNLLKMAETMKETKI